MFNQTLEDMYNYDLIGKPISQVKNEIIFKDIIQQDFYEYAAYRIISDIKFKDILENMYNYDLIGKYISQVNNYINFKDIIQQDFYEYAAYRITSDIEFQEFLEKSEIFIAYYEIAQMFA